MRSQNRKANQMDQGQLSIVAAETLKYILPRDGLLVT
jgi:hypothetical protein